MCCFSTKTEVHQTNIFARLTRADTQYLVYQMEYSAKEPTAMILPLPVALPASEASVSFRDLKAYPALFADCARGFPVLRPSNSFHYGEKSAVALVTPIAVHEVGDFIASFVPSIADFERLDPRFSISKDTWNQIPAYQDYGFAVFQLKELAGTPHPIALEFQTRLRDAVFFPTVHIHDGTVHKEDDFDHALYMQHAGFDAKVDDYVGPDQVDAATGMVRSDRAASTFVEVGHSQGAFDGTLLVHRRTIVGRNPNVDTIVSLSGTGQHSGCGRCDIGANSAGGVRDKSALGAGASMALAGLAWIIRRRDDRGSTRK